MFQVKGAVGALKLCIKLKVYVSCSFQKELFGFISKSYSQTSVKQLTLFWWPVC